MAFLEIHNLSKTLGQEKVIGDLSLEMERGELLVIFGPSGCGKTVLLRLISGIMQPDRGSLSLDGSPIGHLEPEHRDVAMAFQNFALYPHMRAFDNIASPLQAHGYSEADIKARVQEVAELLRIAHVLHHYPKELSNGQKQRTALARSLVRRPSVILLDDPLRNVDAKIRYEMRLELPRVLRSYQCTALYVTQDYREAMALGDRVGVLYDGKFQQLANPAEIYRNPVNTRIAQLFGDPPINLLPVRPEREGDEVTVSIGGRRLPAPPSLRDVEPRDCLFGFRPEDVSVSLEESEGSIPVELDTLTPLNVRAVMLMRTEDKQEILSSCPEDQVEHEVRGRQQAWATIDTTRAICFDRDSGARL